MESKPLAIYTQAQTDIKAIASRMRIPVHEAAKMMLQLHILPAVKEITKGELDNGQS